MSNSGELRARARVLYDFAQSADEWGERVELRFRAIELEVEAEELEADKIPEPYVIVSRPRTSRLRR